MGIGASKNESTLKSFNTSVTENLSSTMIEIAQSSVSRAEPTQRIDIIATASGDVNIDGVSQVMVANIDVQQFLSNITEQTLKSKMTSAVEVAAKDNQAVDHQLIIGASLSSNKSAAEVRTENINRIVNSYSYSQFSSLVAEILPKQSISIDAIGKNVNIKNISQYIKVDMVVKQMAENMTKTLSDIVSENSVSVKKETDQKASGGLSTAWLVSGIIIVVVVIAIIAGFVWYFGGSDIAKDYVAQQQAQQGGMGMGMGGMGFDRDGESDFLPMNDAEW
jgi:hypothetical protein